MEHIGTNKVKHTELVIVPLIVDLGTRWQ